jgi:WD40 repeat protein
MIKIWDLGSGSLVRSLAGHSGSALSVAISSDGQLLFSSGSDGKIKVWDPSTGEPLHILSGHPEGVGSVASNPDGQLLASGGYDHTIKIWRKVRAFAEERTTLLPTHSSSPNSPPRLDPAPGRPPDLPD